MLIVLPLIHDVMGIAHVNSSPVCPSSLSLSLSLPLSLSLSLVSKQIVYSDNTHFVQICVGMPALSSLQSSFIVFQRDYIPPSSE